MDILTRDVISALSGLVITLLLLGVGIGLLTGDWNMMVVVFAILTFGGMITGSTLAIHKFLGRWSK